MRTPIPLLALALTALATAPAHAGRPMAVDDLFALKRVADPQISPDGTAVAYSVTAVDFEANKSSTSLYLVPAVGGEPRRLTNAAGKHDRHPRWSPDGKRLLFESTRSGTPQLWSIDIAGGEARQLTSLSTGASGGVWSPDGRRVAFVSAVYPEFSGKPFPESDALNKKKADEIEASPVKAKVFTRLFFRHWDSYVEDKRQHLFVADVGADGGLGAPRDVTPGDRDAYPTSTTFSGGDDFCFSGDSQHLLFTAVPAADEAWNTNYDLCRVAVNNTAAEWETLTKNPAADITPKLSPDGSTLLYRAQKRAGFEADRWELFRVSVSPDGKFAGDPQSVTGPLLEKHDQSVDSYAWAGPRGVAYTAEDNGSTVIRTATFPPGTGNEQVRHATLAVKHTNGDLSGHPTGRLAFTQSSMRAPNEVFALTLTADGGTPPVALSKANDTVLEGIDRPVPESVTVKGDGGTPMQMWLLKPPGFVEGKRYPVAFLVHGGPQGAWNDGWSFRWNPQVWAARGYVVALPNPRGSTGFGQKYVDEISGDWGGKCYGDLMAGADFVEALPYVDKDRVAAAGASFGGYMVNWFAVQTGRFRCLISHCGVWNFDSMHATTEELWFDEWEHGGLPWERRDSYEKFSPHRFAGNLAKFKTPTLIVHNDLDFRVPVSEGLQYFTLLQRQRVPSRMVNFPDEGHWVTKPKNSQAWHREVFAWLEKYAPPGPK